MSTRDAAAYVPGLCEAWSSDILAYFTTTPGYADARKAVKTTDTGRVHRHLFRGDTDPSEKERREVENDASTAGCRNPAYLRRSWPELWQTMEPVKELLLHARRFSPDLQNLVECCGANPSRDPPREASILAIRHGLERIFQLP